MDEKEKKLEEEQIEEEEQEESIDNEEEFTYTIDNNGINNDYNKNDYQKKSMIYILIGVGFLFLIIVSIIVFVNKKEKKVSKYSEIEEKLVIAAKRYYEKYPEQLPQIEGNKISIDAEKLIENSYLKPFSEMVEENVKCTGTVKIYKNEKEYAYFPFLNCGQDYKSIKFNEKIIEDNLTTTKDGIYKINNEYVFRGEYPNNYIKFDKKIWRIIKINEDESIQMMLIEKKPEKTKWDDRYNNEFKGYSGKNDFRISRILDYLQKSYEKNTYISETNKKILTKHKLCIGKISEYETPISELNVCTETYDDLYIGLLTAKDVLIPSLDENCKSTYDISCTNYNYFNSIDIGWTSNASFQKSNKVYSSSRGAIVSKEASNNNTIRPVININGDVLYKNGKGTEEEPYVIE
jgi:hypothetical protein